MKGVLDELAPEGASIRFHSTQALLESIAGGETPDVVILTSEGVDKLIAQGRAGAKVELGNSGVGLAVRAGAGKPDISNVAALEKALLSAASVAHSRSGASGLYFAELLERRGWDRKLRRRVIVEKGPVAAVVASGEVEIGVQLLCELAPVKGIDIVGPFPDEVQNLSRFSSAILRPSKDAEAFMAFLRSAEAKAAMRRNLFNPG